MKILHKLIYRNYNKNLIFKNKCCNQTIQNNNYFKNCTLLFVPINKSPVELTELEINS